MTGALVSLLARDAVVFIELDYHLASSGSIGPIFERR